MVNEPIVLPADGSAPPWVIAAGEFFSSLTGQGLAGLGQLERAADALGNGVAVAH